MTKKYLKDPSNFSQTVNEIARVILCLFVLHSFSVSTAWSMTQIPVVTTKGNRMLAIQVNQGEEDDYNKIFNYDTPNFRAFLGSLGLQSWSGDPKPAWEALMKEANPRGFGG